MTLNGVIALSLRFSPNSIALQADYVRVVEDRPIMSVKYCLPDPVFHFWPKLTHPAARSLCHSWATCKLCLHYSGRRIHGRQDRKTNGSYVTAFSVISYSLLETVA